MTDGLKYGAYDSGVFIDSAYDSKGVSYAPRVPMNFACPSTPHTVLSIESCSRRPRHVAHVQTVDSATGLAFPFPRRPPGKAAVFLGTLRPPVVSFPASRPGFSLELEI